MFSKIKRSLIALAVIGMAMQSCSKDDLELRPEFSLDALENPSSLEQVEQVLQGAYARFRITALPDRTISSYYSSGSGTGAGWALMPDVMSDNLYETNETLANSRTMADWLYQPNTDEVENMYAAPYTVIAAANIVLRDVDKFTTAENQKKANRIKGQALAIRAMAHFDLFRYFATKYDRNSTSDLAVAYVKEFLVSTSNQPARLSNKDFYDNLFADLTAAQGLLSDVDATINTSAVSRPYFDLAAVYALQARAYLYAQQWTEAITASTNAINLRPLASRTAFAGMYTEAAAGEIIWNVQFESGQSGPTYLIYFPAQQRSYFRPAPEVAEVTGLLGLIKATDVRFDTYFSEINSNISSGLSVTKYSGKGTQTDGAANFVAFKTGEMYLIRAEARARSNQEGLALQDLNALRAARITGYLPVAGLTGDALLTAIANERRKELVGEGHRFFDLKRTTRTIQRGAACGNTQLSPSGACTLAPNAREWALPIPEVVLRANPNMRQNPGYN
ncbi:RagB/SusD family nutrient uptake outer membrane protein [Flavisolibacter sp. BT320]|nr:RagB/SusD family nutrient uptake outer membrane protein [Flavisolibacter longurius]